MSAPTIIEAMDDPHLFGGAFAGPSWDAWRAFLTALFALPLPDARFAQYRACTGRQTPPATPFREAALVGGRRGGKSRVLAAVAVYLACFRDYARHLAPGEMPIVAVIAADRRQARVLLGYVAGLLRSSPPLAGLIVEELAESVRLGNRVVIEIHTSNIGSPRGRTYIAVLADEIAFWNNSDSSANPDTDVIAAVRPGLASIPGSLLLMASSPYARRGVLWTIYRKHWGQDDARVLVWRGSTETMNPTIDRALIAEAREDDPAAAAAEYDGEFRTDIAAFVTREVVDACTPPGRHELPPLSGTRYAAFTDPSGGSADRMTLAIAHREGERAILDAVREIRPPFSPESVVVDFAELLKSYGLHSVTGDRYAGEWPRERFREHGITYELADKPKSDIYRDLLPVLNSGKAELLDLPRLTAQLCGLERRTARGGRDSIDHAPGAHDDVANAVAGAICRVARKARALVISDAALAMSRMPPTPHHQRQIRAFFNSTER